MTKPTVALLLGVGLSFAGCQGATTARTEAQSTSASASATSGGTATPGCVDVGCTPSDPAPAPACPSGQTPVYQFVGDPGSGPGGADFGGSGVSAGPGGASMTMTCETTSCATGQVGVDLPTSEFSQRDGSDGTTSAGGVTCVATPPSCPSGQFPAYVPPGSSSPFGGFGLDGSSDGDASTGTWHCVGSCDVMVQYGPEYGGREVCAPAPPACASGTMATFSADDESWHCNASCGGSYDEDPYADGLVCVPC